MSKYIIYYTWYTQGRQSIDMEEYVEDRLAMDYARNGFWVDEEGKPCLTSKSKYFIPPHHVKTVYKETIH